MRRFTTVLLLLLFVPIVVFGKFSDLPETHWAYDTIIKLSENGVIDGYEDGTFRPEALVTRAEGAKLLCVMANLPEGEASYEDVTEDKWYYTYVRDCGQYIEKENIFNGDTPLTREEVAYAVTGIKGISEEAAAPEFSDCDRISNPGLIAAAVKAGFISGYEDGTFRPQGNITRAEFCSMIDRAFDADEKLPDTINSEWELTKLVAADLDNFRLNAIIDRNNRLLFIEPEEEPGFVFTLDLTKEDAIRETFIRFSEVSLKVDGKDSGKFYNHFKPISFVLENDINRTSLFGEFVQYTEDKNEYEVSCFRALDITYGIEDYASFEEGKAQYEDSEDCIPMLLHIHNEKYTVVYDGKSSVYKFDRVTGLRDGKLYAGNENTCRGFLSVGDRMYGVDKNWNLYEYDLEGLKWNESICTFDADTLGIRHNKFWLWNKTTGIISTANEKGDIAKLHSGVTLDNISAEDIDVSKLDSHMLVYDENTFILYDGTNLLMLKKK